MMDANINISAVNYNCKTHLNILSCYVVLLFLLMVCAVVVVVVVLAVVLAVVCACVYVWLFSFNYTIWRLYLFLTSFFNLCTLVALFICVRSLFSSMSLSLHSFWQGTLFVYYYNSARSFRYHFLFCSCKSDVGLFRFVCVERVTLFNTSVLETIFDEQYLCVYVRAKVYFLFYKILHLFCWLKFSFSISREDIERYRFRGREMVYLPWNCDKSFCQYNIIILLRNLGVFEKEK